jgi:hypothetical protein
MALRWSTFGVRKSNFTNHVESLLCCERRNLVNSVVFRHQGYGPYLEAPFDYIEADLERQESLVNGDCQMERHNKERLTEDYGRT